RAHGIRFQRTELVSKENVVAILGAITTIVWVLYAVVLVDLYVPLALSFFPQTAPLAKQIWPYLLAPVYAAWAGIVEYVPNLLTMAVIVLFAFAANRVSQFLFREVAAGRIAWRGFHREWAKPTGNLVRGALLALTAVLVFPYLPGSKSPALQGVSIFIGVLLSLGSSSAVANAVAGTILIYMRAFQVGHRVRIAEAEGDVIEKTMLVTRIRTIKNVVITIPNAAVLNNHVINYSASAADRGLILHTTVTIGYDAPWRQVHELLIAAALATEHVLDEPRPFVLQTALNDFYVSYQINAYTRRAELMADVSSQLHRNIQDRFNEAGVEIMSPHYSQLRDGNPIAIPDTYKPAGYHAPAFRVEAAAPGASAPAGSSR
ncbi:MAG TPA: mechanosensitive ion channel protein, partial [Solibacterales bacterium]|nr:mechanosensitive ion channel protein [Bryobacterales bacterium]